MGLAAELRYKYILDELKDKGRIHVKDTAKRFGVTEVTIRRDLSYLAKRGL
ncbi:MAG: DeoR family transcriptional regulator, partial [Planctomycetota bacterium]